MSTCAHCGGTGRAPDPGLQQFLAATETRSDEELLMRGLYPQLFDAAHVDMLFELSPTSPAETPFRMHVLEDDTMQPGEWRVAQVPENTWERLPRPDHPNAKAPELHAPIRTGADVLREAAAAREAERIEREQKRQDPTIVKQRLEESGKRLGFL